ncbi:MULTISPECIES: succinate dehydrogenase, cytochrome b556 subunit [Azospirillum]|uniref:Succinate dehydrogenase cytochrome b556 subunit n=1 Tax=Azospirillum lipoferum TaxID=193 RepID=A0A5A9GTG2_AZOLI|nr:MULTISPECIES: succinate dehydrogenase, cytochrome b556 subunit [Azospirillum]KAA0597728.1 succinate dehydrogenase, cytochrome b556 subunit [Azospirillum lipoferum]MDW5534368.1 succinate dehydrogenase, cytochrome b556 subunit [Azospirillum sp. NL1]
MANGSGRPLSPHLQVYKLPLTAVMSITHRITGVGLAVGTLLLVWWLVAAAAGPQAFARAQGFIGSFFGLLLMFGWSAALYYHLCNGIRHLVWDAGKSFELTDADRNNKVVLVATAVLTVLTWIVGLAVW